MEFCDIQSLVKLFKTEDGNSDEEEQSTPPSAPAPPKITPYAKLPPPEPQQAPDDEDAFIPPESSTEWKKTPKWDISYRQQVTPSDVFLQMGAKTPSTSSCENMIVTIDLPGEHMQNITIKVLKDSLEVNSPCFALNLTLPHPVQPREGNAKWDNEGEKLIVTLVMDREFDFVNF